LLDMFKDSTKPKFADRMTRKALNQDRIPKFLTESTVNQHIMALFTPRKPHIQIPSIPNNQLFG
jgi:hypothetical protein